MQHGFPRNPDSSVVWESEAQKWGSQQWKERKVGDIFCPLKEIGR